MRYENAKFMERDDDAPARSLVSVEAGVSEMLTRMETGRFKVFVHLNDWFEEFRLYHRKDGVIVKEFDDLLCATRYGLMDLRFAEARTKYTWGDRILARQQLHRPRNPEAA